MARLTDDQKRFVLETNETGCTVTQLKEAFNNEFGTSKEYQTFRAMIRSKWYAKMKAEVDGFVEEVEDPPPVEADQDPPEPEPVEPHVSTQKVEDVEVHEIDSNGDVVEDDDPLTEEDLPVGFTLDEVEEVEDEDPEYLETVPVHYDEDGNEPEPPDTDDVDLDSLPSDPPF